MTFEVEKVQLGNASKAGATNPIDKSAKEKEFLNSEIQKTLKNDKKARETKKDELTDHYEALGLSHRQAKKFAQRALDNLLAAEKMEFTEPHLDKSKYKEAKTENKGTPIEDKYIRNKGVREFITSELGKKLFFDSGYDFKLQKPADDEGYAVVDPKSPEYAEYKADLEKALADTGVKLEDQPIYYKKELPEFDGDKLKEFADSWSGGDHKQNLDERKALKSAYGLSKHQAKKIAEYSGQLTEKDLTWLYRGGIVAAGAGIGAVAATPVKLAATLLQIVNIETPDGITTESQYTEGSKTFSRTAQGAKVGALAALPGALFVKDRGGRDLFNGVDPNVFIEQTVAGVKGKSNRVVMQGTIDMLKEKGYSTEDISKCIAAAVGENTAGKANKNEITAFFEAAKLMPNKKDIKTEEQVKQEVKNEQPEKKEPKFEPLKPAGISVPKPSLKPDKIEPMNIKTPATVGITVRFGDTVSKIAARYGLKNEEVQEMIKKTFPHRTDCDKKVPALKVGETLRLELQPEVLEKLAEIEKDITAQGEIKKYNNWYHKQDFRDDCEDWKKANPVLSKKEGANMVEEIKERCEKTIQSVQEAMNKPIPRLSLSI